MGRGEEAVFRFLHTNGGVIHRDEAIALGMAPATLTRRIRTGHLIGAGRGIYVLPGVLATDETTLRAATRALHAAVSHWSAARLHGLDTPQHAGITVSVPVRRTNRFAGVEVHQLTDLTSADTEMIAGMSTTVPTRTIIDLAAVTGTKRLASVLDQSVRMQLTSYESVAERLGQLARKGKPGVTRLRSILESRTDDMQVPESSLETLLIDLIIGAGLPLPDLQYRPEWLRHMSGRVDFAYPDVRVLVEADSRRWHGSAEAFQMDRTRDNLAQIAGWISLRFTWEDISDRPAYVVESIARALSARRSDQI